MCPKIHAATVGRPTNRCSRSVANAQFRGSISKAQFLTLFRDRKLVIANDFIAWGFESNDFL